MAGNSRQGLGHNQGVLRKSRNNLETPAISKPTTEFAQLYLSRSKGGHPQREGTYLGVFVPIWLVLPRCEATNRFWVCLICVISPYSTGAVQDRVGLELAEFMNPQVSRDSNLSEPQTLVRDIESDISTPRLRVEQLLRGLEKSLGASETNLGLQGFCSEEKKPNETNPPKIQKFI